MLGCKFGRGAPKPRNKSENHEKLVEPPEFPVKEGYFVDPFFNVGAILRSLETTLTELVKHPLGSFNGLSSTLPCDHDSCGLEPHKQV